MDFLYTCDVELTSIPDNREEARIAEEVLRVGLPRILALCSKRDIPATFYFTANLVETRPECIDLVRAAGHEVGSHGLRHDPVRAYDTMSYGEQLASLVESKRVLERNGSGPVTAFRGPEARINADTVRALGAARFTSDSSVCPQRFDGPLSRGFRRKSLWLLAPRRPYFLSEDSTISPGGSEVLEIPISALVFPFIGTTMRVSPSICRALRRLLFSEARRREGWPVVFLFHPNECLEPGRREPGGVGGEPVSDSFRTALKLRNLGAPAVALMDEVLEAARGAGFEFKTASRYRSEFRSG
jgi:hypothetical protein